MIINFIILQYIQHMNKNFHELFKTQLQQNLNKQCTQYSYSQILTTLQNNLNKIAEIELKQLEQSIFRKFLQAKIKSKDMYFTNFYYNLITLIYAKKSKLINLIYDFIPEILIFFHCYLTENNQQEVKKINSKGIEQIILLIYNTELPCYEIYEKQIDMTNNIFFKQMFPTHHLKQNRFDYQKETKINFLNKSKLKAFLLFLYYYNIKITSLKSTYSLFKLIYLFSGGITKAQNFSLYLLDKKDQYSIFCHRISEQEFSWIILQNNQSSTYAQQQFQLEKNVRTNVNLVQMKSLNLQYICFKINIKIYFDLYLIMMEQYIQQKLSKNRKPKSKEVTQFYIRVITYNTIFIIRSSIIMTQFKQVFQILKTRIIISNLLFTLLPIIVCSIFQLQSGQHLIYYDKPFIFQYGVSYDGMHFLTNQYNWQINYAFLPGYVSIISASRFLLRFFVQDIRIPLIVVMILFNKVLNIYSAVHLYQIVQLYQIDEQCSLPKIASTIFLFNPASIFFNNVYSESLYVFLTFLAIKKGFQKIDQSKVYKNNPDKYIQTNAYSIFLFSLSTIVRSIGILNSLFYIIPLLEFIIKLVNKKYFSRCVKPLLTIILISFIISFPFLLYLTAGYIKFCYLQIQKLSFCSNIFPNIYTYVESAYFAVGFLKFYYTGRYTQMVYGLISITIAVLMMRLKYHNTPQKKGLFISFIFMILISIFLANLQPSTRFLCTYVPFYIHFAGMLKKQKSYNNFQTIAIYYLFTYNALGIFLHSTANVWM